MTFRAGIRSGARFRNANSNQGDLKMKATVHFTAKDGAEATINGGTRALDALEALFENAGIKWNEQIGTWDAGFYEQPRPTVKILSTREIHDLLMQQADLRAPENDIAGVLMQLASELLEAAVELEDWSPTCCKYHSTGGNITMGCGGDDARTWRAK